MRPGCVMLKCMSNKVIRAAYCLGMALMALSACRHSASNTAPTVAVSEDTLTKNALQGIWADDEGGAVQFRAEGDSLYYPGKESRPLYFKTTNGQLVICGADTVSYEIARLEKDCFWYHSITGELIKLHRSEYELDSLEFNDEPQAPIAMYDKVVKRDSVVMFDGHRYRGYVYINPSTRKVYKTSYNENGMKIEQVYYDNVIHICVYEGKHSLYAKDFTKNDFESVVDVNFLKGAILSDMVFTGVSHEGFHYEASLSIPNETLCYQIAILISRDGKLSLQKS